MSGNMHLYHAVVTVTSDYLGPAAERFINRQIEGHLGKEPGQLNKTDLLPLIDWIRVSFAFLTEDRQLIDELTKRLRALTKE